MALRICDLHAGEVSGNRKVHNLVVKGSFHGRTLSAALLTDTTREAYSREKAFLINRLQDSTGMNYVLSCEANDIDGLKLVSTWCLWEHHDRKPAGVPRCHCCTQNDDPHAPAEHSGYGKVLRTEVH